MHLTEYLLKRTNIKLDIPMNLVRESDDKFALRIYMSCLLYEDMIKPRPYSLKDIADDAELFPGKKVTKKMLEKVRDAVDYLDTRGYITVDQGGTVPFEGDVRKVMFTYRAHDYQDWKTDNQYFVQVDIKECVRLLSLAADIDLNKCGVTSLNVIRVYLMAKRNSYFWQQGYKEQLPVYNDPFSSLGTKGNLNITNRTIMLAIDALEEAGAVSALYGVRDNDTAGTDGKGGKGRYSRTSVAIFKWTNDWEAEGEAIELKAKQRINEINGAPYRWIPRKYTIKRNR